MIIYPAIDILQGSCIRLYQGNYTKKTIYSENPSLVAQQFVSQGAEWLHIVDLQGAENPNKNQEELIYEVIKKINCKVQFGGGIRDKDKVKNLLNNGVNRIVIGSLAVKEPQRVLKWLDEFGADKIALALDVKFSDNELATVAINAWKTITNYSLFDLLSFYQKSGLKHIICTDINRDGTGSGPNYALYQKILDDFPNLNLQASGGIDSLLNIQVLEQMNISGAIIGRSLYENKFTLPEALSC